MSYIDTDSFSVFVRNLDFSTTTEDLEEHFRQCGEINRITILIDKYTGYPKGYEIK